MNHLGRTDFKMKNRYFDEISSTDNTFLFDIIFNIFLHVIKDNVPFFM